MVRTTGGVDMLTKVCKIESCMDITSDQKWWAQFYALPLIIDGIRMKNVNVSSRNTTFTF